jgi:hypothetical protein
VVGHVCCQIIFIQGFLDQGVSEPPVVDGLLDVLALLENVTNHTSKDFKLVNN